MSLIDKIEIVTTLSDEDWELFKFSSGSSSLLFKGFRHTLSIISFSPKDATSRNETVTLEPFYNFMHAWEGEAWMSSTSSTRGSYSLVQT